MTINFRKKEKLYQYLTIGLVALLILLFALFLIQLTRQLTTALKPGQSKELNIKRFNVLEWENLKKTIDKTLK